MSDSVPLIVGVTGASGGPYARRLLQCLARADVPVHVMMSEQGAQILRSECDVNEATLEAVVGRDVGRLELHDNSDLSALPASGSFRTAGMVICPCSSHTLGCVASGMADRLLTRAAAVTLKEQRRLVLVHREMPLSVVDVENMRRVQAAGGVICPAAPAFYMKPTTVQEMVDFVVGRILDLFGIEHQLNVRWQPPSSRHEQD